MTDPRDTDPRLRDPVMRDDPVLRDDTGGMWGWIAGLTLLALIAFVVAAGWNSDRQTASNAPSAPISTGSAPPRNAMPPSTTGSGTTSPQPPAPAQVPAPAKPDAQ